MVICLERGADLHMAQLMPLPLTVTCFSKIQTGFAFLVPAYLGSPGKRAVKRVCACVYRSTCVSWYLPLVQSFIACMPSLMATSAFELWRRHWISPQQRYLHCLRTK